MAVAILLTAGRLYSSVDVMLCEAVSLSGCLDCQQLCYAPTDGWSIFLSEDLCLLDCFVPTTMLVI